MVAVSSLSLNERCFFNSSALLEGTLLLGEVGSRPYAQTSLNFLLQLQSEDTSVIRTNTLSHCSHRRVWAACATLAWSPRTVECRCLEHRNAHGRSVEMSCQVGAHSRLSLFDVHLEHVVLVTRLLRSLMIQRRICALICASS